MFESTGIVIDELLGMELRELERKGAAFESVNVLLDKVGALDFIN